jgi:hypothetical protein
VAVARWVALGKPELDLDVCGNVRELGNDLRDVGVELAKIPVHDLHSAVHLLVADVLWAIEVNDVKDDGNHDELVPVAGFGIGTRLALKYLICFKIGLAKEGIPAEEALEGFGLSARAWGRLARRSSGEGPNAAHGEKDAHGDKLQFLRMGKIHR